MLKIYNTDLNTSEFRRLNDFEIGCWVHLENPNEEEIEKVSSSLGIKKDFLVSILDDDEKNIAYKNIDPKNLKTNKEKEIPKEKNIDKN